MYRFWGKEPREADVQSARKINLAPRTARSGNCHKKIKTLKNEKKNFLILQKIYFSYKEFLQIIIIFTIFANKTLRKYRTRFGI